MATQFDICSRALRDLGEESINSFTGTNAGEICGDIYPEYIQYLLTRHPWKFTLKKGGSDV